MIEDNNDEEYEVMMCKRVNEENDDDEWNVKW